MLISISFLLQTLIVPCSTSHQQIVVALSNTIDQFAERNLSVTMTFQPHTDKKGSIIRNVTDVNQYDFFSKDAIRYFARKMGSLPKEIFCYCGENSFYIAENDIGWALRDNDFYKNKQRGAFEQFSSAALSNLYCISSGSLKGILESKHHTISMYRISGKYILILGKNMQSSRFDRFESVCVLVKLSNDMKYAYIQNCRAYYRGNGNMYEHLVRVDAEFFGQRLCFRRAVDIETVYLKITNSEQISTCPDSETYRTDSVVNEDFHVEAVCLTPEFYGVQRHIPSSQTLNHEPVPLNKWIILLPIGIFIVLWLISRRL